MNRVLITGCLVMIMLSRCAHFQLLIPEKEPAYDYSRYTKIEKDIHKRLEKFILRCWQEQQPVALYPQVRIENVHYDASQKVITVRFNSYFAYNPFRPENVNAIYAAVRKHLGRRYRRDVLTLYCLNQPIEQLIPNIYREDQRDYDLSRFPKLKERPMPLVRNLSRPFQPTKGLWGFNVALWASHGWYYNARMQRWEWQRPRLFQTVEDLLPTSFVLPFLLPMLENAGATTFIPRERDLQMHEVIVDNDGSSSASRFTLSEGLSVEPQALGFAIGKPPYSAGVNPFLQGTSLTIIQDGRGGKVTWLPDIPQKGEYAVYVAYRSDSLSVNNAHYIVYHAGGKTEFVVNQQIGGATWIYLGQFQFQAGLNPEMGKVELLIPNEATYKHFSVDAVRFGGGMGNIARGGTTSGRPRFMEAARYYLQYAGFPDTLVFSLNKEQDDYVDDYQCRGEWVNFLNGQPCGPNKARQHPGLGIPIDLSLAFHTDAGIAYDDIIGTLAIYSIEDYDSALIFPDSVSRYVNRDLADIVQTEIERELQGKWDSKWKRRHLYNRQYSEAFRPNVPAMLLELLSHQNFLDMQYALDPRFRFDVARAIYKGILKFITFQHYQPYVVQPLPVSHLQALLIEPGVVRLEWRPVADPLEPTALPDRYLVYMRENDQGFDNGRVVTSTALVIRNLKPGTIYSFKVTAVNAGGESFPSEILAVGYLAENPDPVLIVNGFDRVGPPAVITAPEFSGFADFLDQGVPYRFDFNYTGMQFDYNRKSPWVTNDRPGWGASHADWETTIIPGNTFDFTVIHGQAMLEAGYSFCSCSDEAIEAGQVELTQYRLVDILLGEEKESRTARRQQSDFKTFSPTMQRAITAYCLSGGGLFLSGSYIATDLFARGDSSDIKFGRNVLKMQWVTDHAARKGICYATGAGWLPVGELLRFNTELHPQIYTVEAPDALEPVDSCGQVILRYQENQFSAGVSYKGAYKVVALGFPFETITTASQRRQLMANIMQFLDQK